MQNGVDEVAFEFSGWFLDVFRWNYSSLLTAG